MDLGMVVAVGAAVACAAACVWLLVGRAALLARAASAEATAAGVEGERERMAAELGAVQAKVEEMGGRNQALSGKVLLLEQEMDDLARRSREELVHAQQILAEQLKAVVQRERDLKERYASLDTQVSETFKGLAADALKSSNVEFLKLAKESLAAEQTKARADIERGKLAVEQLIGPIADTLKKTDEKLAAFDKSRAESAATITEQLRAAADASKLLRDETGKLIRALRDPHVRGAYGSTQLKRLAELSGMLSYCDFEVEHATRDSDGNLFRPDMIVRQPNGREIVVDAKANIHAYLESLEAPTPEAAKECLDRFAKHVTDQVGKLARKNYWKQYEGSPELVVMFMPGDHFVQAALDRNPELWETALSQGIVLASPWTLFVILRVASLLWDERRLGEEAKDLRKLGVELHERTVTAMTFVARLGSSLNGAVDRYNDFVASYQSRLEPTLRKFEDAGVKGGTELPEVGTVNVVAREVEVKPEVKKPENTDSATIMTELWRS